MGTIERLLLHQLTAGRYLRRRLHDVQVGKVSNVVQDVLVSTVQEFCPDSLLVVVLLLQPVFQKTIVLHGIDRNRAATISNAAEGRGAEGAPS